MRIPHLKDEKQSSSCNTSATFSCKRPFSHNRIVIVPHDRLAQVMMNSNVAHCVMTFFLGLMGVKAAPMSRRELGTSMCSASLSAVISPCADKGRASATVSLIHPFGAAGLARAVRAHPPRHDRLHDVHGHGPELRDEDGQF